MLATMMWVWLVVSSRHQVCINRTRAGHLNFYIDEVLMLSGFGN
jgi:hypothetical protein